MLVWAAFRDEAVLLDILHFSELASAKLTIWFLGLSADISHGVSWQLELITCVQLACSYARHSFLVHWQHTTKPSCPRCTWQHFFFSWHYSENTDSGNKSLINFCYSQVRFLSFLSLKLLLTVQAEGDVDGADVSDSLEVWDAGALQVGGGGGFTHIYPADSLLGIDKVHSHCLLGGDGGQPGSGATQGGAADVMEVSNQQHRQTIDWLWEGRPGQWNGGEGKSKRRQRTKWGRVDIRGKSYEEEIERCQSHTLIAHL